MTWATNKTTAAYTPAVLLRPGQPPHNCNVQAIRCVTPQQATDMLERGIYAWVDAEEWRKAQEAGESSGKAIS